MSALRPSDRILIRELCAVCGAAEVEFEIMEIIETWKVEEELASRRQKLTTATNVIYLAGWRDR